MDNKEKKFRFFEKTCLFADISIDNDFEMLFLTFTNFEVNFKNQELR